jgi:hypothetical protein
MNKNTYHIKETKQGRKFEYTGDLKEAIEKAREDLRKHEKKIERIEAFIRSAERSLEKSEADNKRTESLQYVYAPDLERCTPALIKQIAESGQAASIWKIGDKKKITTTTGEEVEIAIADFDHDELADGSGKAPITFTMTHSFATAQNMNSSNTNVGGWTSCAMRSRMDTILKTLPQEWQDIIVSVKKKTSAGNQQSTISTTEDKLFLFSEVEVFGTTTYSFTGEGSQYPYFATQANRIKTLGINGSAYNWWERSPYDGYTTTFCSVYSSGYANFNNASGARGVSVGFCV